MAGDIQELSARSDRGLTAGSKAPATSVAELGSADIESVRRQLVAAAVPEDAGERMRVLRALEDLKAAVTAVQATVVLAVDASTRQEEASAGVPSARRGRDVPVRLALAMRESPARARSFLGAARAWHTEMPHTLDALRNGHLSAWRATVLVRETAHLPVEARSVVDAETCADPMRLEGMGTAALTGRVRRRAIELDPAAAADRARRAESERAVWIRPAPDTMTYVTALLPVARGVGVYAALRRAADSARAAGDPRSRGQVMADSLVELVTGQRAADEVPVMVNLVVSDATLLGAGSEPGLVADDAGPGGGVVPAQVARNLVANGLDAGAAWVRRLYAAPTGRLVAASSSGRFFAGGLAALLRVRDQGLCRMPHCDAPIRHLDHVTPVAEQGLTDLDEGQGMCGGCNQAKNAGGLRQTVVTGADRHTVVTTTATGEVHVSTAPAPPRPAVSPSRTVGPWRAGPAGVGPTWADPAGVGPTRTGRVRGGPVRAGVVSAGGGRRGRPRTRLRADRRPAPTSPVDEALAELLGGGARVGSGGARG